MPSDLKRATPEVMAVILYYSNMGVEDKVVSKLIELKTGVDNHTALRIISTRDKDFPRKNRPWNLEGIGQEISEHVDRDTFLDLTKINVACESILLKAGSIHCSPFDHVC